MSLLKGNAPCTFVTYANRRGSECFTWQGPVEDEAEALERADQALRGAWRLMSDGKKPHLLKAPTVMTGGSAPGRLRWTFKGSMLARGLEVRHPALKADLRHERTHWGRAIVAGNPASGYDEFLRREVAWHSNVTSVQTANQPSIKSTRDVLTLEVTSLTLPAATCDALMASTLALALYRIWDSGRDGNSYFSTGASPISAEKSASLCAAQAASYLADREGSAASVAKHLEEIAFLELGKTYAAACRQGARA